MVAVRRRQSLEADKDINENGFIDTTLPTYESTEESSNRNALYTTYQSPDNARGSDHDLNSTTLIEYTTCNPHHVELRLYKL
jgi:hypothetical protein